MISLKLAALVVVTAVSVMAGGPPIRRSLSPLDVTLRSVSPHPAPATPGACRGADKLELQVARRELAAAKEELQREREEVKRLKQVEQRGAVDEAAAPLPLTAADVAELFRLLKDMNINKMRLEREMAGGAAAGGAASPPSSCTSSSS